MSDLRRVYGRNYTVYDRLRQCKRPYTVVYDRRNRGPGNAWEDSLSSDLSETLLFFLRHLVFGQSFR